VGGKSPSHINGEKKSEVVELMRLGGVKGGHARAAALTPQQRRAIAVKAANARWSKAKRPKP